MITIDIIGNMYADIILDGNGEYESGGDALPGFHVNTIPAVDAWVDFRVEPISKRRIFAGMESETACYVFADESEFRIEAKNAGIDLGDENEIL